MTNGILQLDEKTINSLKQKHPQITISVRRNTYQWWATCTSPYYFWRYRWEVGKKSSDKFCMKSAPVRGFIWSVFSRIRTKYGDILRKFPYSVRIRENMDQKKLCVSSLFTQWRNKGGSSPSGLDTDGWRKIESIWQLQIRSSLCHCWFH